MKYVNTKHTLPYVFWIYSIFFNIINKLQVYFVYAQKFNKIFKIIRKNIYLIYTYI